MYNNYNPYQGYGQNVYTPTYNQLPQYQQPIATNQGQMLQNSAGTMQNSAERIIPGKMIENVEMAKTIEAPLNGSTIFMPLLDKSAIVTKRLTANGTSEIIVFKPVLEEKEEDNRITLEDLKQSIDDLKNKSNDDIVDAIEDLRKEIKKKSDK